MAQKNCFNINSDHDFNKIALEVFQFQAHNNIPYRTFIEYLKVDPNTVKSIHQIPYLPIDFFKSHKIVSNTSTAEKTFLSSGTTGQIQSKHFVTDLSVYENSFNRGFTHFYGAIDTYTVLALLPAYLEREGSSLVYMADSFIKASKKPKSGFYLNNLTALAKHLKALDAQGEKVLLIGVSFALLDLVEEFQFELKNTIVMETGGMKGRRKEMIRTELHSVLKKGFGVSDIHSEYGMTELLSQAYSKGNGIFNCPPWMRVLTRDTEDALSLLNNEKSGGLNVIDLANKNSCSFIATQDLGKVYKDGSFEVIGRFDNSDIRGCNLMVL